MSAPFWLILVLGLFLQAGAVWTGEVGSVSVACSSCEVDGCGGCGLTGCSDTVSSCGCVETPSSLPVDSAPPPPSRPVGCELAAGPVWIEVRQNIPSPSREAPDPLDGPFRVATGAAVEPSVTLTVRFCAFLI